MNYIPKTVPTTISLPIPIREEVEKKAKESNTSMTKVILLAWEQSKKTT